MKRKTHSFRELGRIYGVEGELERLKDTVESINAVLLDAEEKQERDRAVQVWIRRLKDLGKTAVAQLVYNDVEVQNFFEKLMWVCVSDNFDVKTIVRKMLELLTNCQIGDESLEKLQTMLRENLTGKRYLLVMDDIWSESHEKWAQLKTYLMGGAQDSKV
ncbi:P-loop containing nucleoside triphosphate hydrolase [Sesbania bispinosa]|nr:P-loop containing nucleoside triphosphate hydrolase [Sesbania bispinosa]